MILAKNKYDHALGPGRRGLVSLGVHCSLLDKAEVLLGASAARKSWKVHKSALNKVRRIEDNLGVSLDFPWGSLSVVHFILGCSLENLKASTVRCYLSQVKKAHLQADVLWDPDMAIPNALMKGMSNTEPGRKKRIAVTPKMLMGFWEDLKRKRKTWPQHDIRLYWMLICFLWSGSFRVSEMLAPTAAGFIEEETFCWNRLSEMSGAIAGSKARWLIVKLLRPKEHREGRGGINVELFELGPETRWCPVRALEKFKADCVLEINKDLPVFRLASGKNLTPDMLNTYIKSVALTLGDYPSDTSVTSHSFRAGIVSLMGAMGEPEDLIKAIGRWTSDSWMLYAKSGRSVRLSDQMRIQKKAAEDFRDWRPVPVMVEPEAGLGEMS